MKHVIRENDIWKASIFKSIKVNRTKFDKISCHFQEVKICMLDDFLLNIRHIRILYEMLRHII